MPFEVPESWCWTTIEAICSKIGSGSTPRGSNYSPSGIPFFRSQNVYDDGLCFDDIKFISRDIHQSMIGTEVLPNDVLLNITGGSLGRCAVVPPIFNVGNVSQHVCILRPVLILPKYLHAFLLSGYFHKSMEVTGSGREGLPKYSIEKMLFPLPPIDEQKRIIDKIGNMMLAIDIFKSASEELELTISRLKEKILELAISGKLTRQNPADEPAIKLLKRITPGYKPTDNRHYANVPFDLPKTWQLTKLKDLCVFLSRGKSPKYSETDKTYPVFAQKCNLKDGGISLEHARFLDPTTVSKWKDVYKLQDGDILINSTGTGTVCRTRLFKTRYLNNYPFVVPDSHVSVIRLHKLISPEYAYIVLSSNASQSYMMDNLAGSTNQKELYISVLENLIFPVPPIEEQRRIVYIVKKISEYIDKIAAAL